MQPNINLIKRNIMRKKCVKERTFATFCTHLCLFISNEIHYHNRQFNKTDSLHSLIENTTALNISKITSSKLFNYIKA